MLYGRSYLVSTNLTLTCQGLRRRAIAIGEGIVLKSLTAVSQTRPCHRPPENLPASSHLL